MLMSATLGSVARCSWRQEQQIDSEDATKTPYPAIWTRTGCVPVQGDSSHEKRVKIAARLPWSADIAAAEAIAAARAGARVLVVRNTVDMARETWAACCAEAPKLVFSVNGVRTLHHSRFAAADRRLLDEAVEAALGKEPPPGGRIIIGTQTLEQSLDIDGDFLVTDLCPMDVLLQRIGRLHRHHRHRPARFETARVVVLCPSDGLDPLTQRPENGLGAFLERNDSLSGVYLDIPGCAATYEQIKARPVWHIPAMNRTLVEAATHPDALDCVAEKHGWQGYRRRILGKELAETMAADLVILDREKSLSEKFPSDETTQTRLGGGVMLTLPKGTAGPFGKAIRHLTLPMHYSHGLAGEEDVMVDQAGAALVLTVGERVFTYDASGLTEGKASGAQYTS